MAIYYAGQPEQLTEAVLEVGLMTHRDVRALFGAVAVAHAIRHLAASHERVPSFLFRLAADIAQAEERVAGEYADRVVSISRHGRGLSACVAHVESVLERPRDQALAALMDEANRHGAEPCCKRPTMGFPPVCVPTCLYLLLTSDSFEDALIDVVNMGGDADSAGAILGAFAGRRTAWTRSRIAGLTASKIATVSPRAPTLSSIATKENSTFPTWSPSSGNSADAKTPCETVSSPLVKTKTAATWARIVASDPMDRRDFQDRPRAIGVKQYRSSRRSSLG